jgi:hypothetical protein
MRILLLQVSVLVMMVPIVASSAVYDEVALNCLINGSGEVLVRAIEKERDFVHLISLYSIAYRDWEGNSPLHIAVKANDRLAICSLFDFGAFVDAQNNVGQTPLHIAVYMGNIFMVKTLLSYGADLDLRDHKERSPSDLATGVFRENCFDEVVNGERKKRQCYISLEAND